MLPASIAASAGDWGEADLGKPLPVPRSIAVVGASDISSGNYYGARVLANLVNGGTTASVFPINPRLAGSELLGLPVYSTLSELPVVPDVVFIVSPVKFVVPTLENAARLGVAVCVVLSAESGSEEARTLFRQQVADVAAKTGMRVIGPNSMGVMNGLLKLNGSFASSTADGTVPPGSIACLSHSGATIASMLQWFGASSTGFSWLVSTGDESATRLEELMEAMVGDPTVSVIMLFLEGVNDGMRFRRSALAAQMAGKPIVLLQVGKSEKGREAVQSHTGRIAGTREVFAAVAAEAGIVETRSFVEFFGTAKTLAQQCVRARALSRNRRAAVITVSGGAASLCADQLAEIGWSLPDFTSATVAAIEAATSQSNVHNPADITGVWRDPSRVAGTMSAIALDDSIDTIFIALGAGGAFANSVAEAISSAARTLTQDVFVSWVGMTSETRAIFDRAGVPAFDDFPLAVQAAEACAKYADSQHRLEDAAGLSRILSKRADTQIDARGERSLWTVTRTLSDLRDAGLPCAPFDISAALDPVDIAERSEKVGYPAVLKLSSSSLNHKSDEGGVALRLPDRSAVLAAARAFQQLAESKRLAEPSVLIQKMASGVEILVGIKRDAVFGLVLVLGLGGTMAELHADIVATPLPTTPARLHALLSRHHKLDTLLDGYRGQAPVDRETLVSFLHAVAQWAESKGATLQEVDLNPVMAAAKDISIVDGRVIWN
jgi:acyl-CoA synthetase (NDP forming)